MDSQTSVPAEQGDARPSRGFSSWPFTLEFAMVLVALILRLALLTLPEPRTDDMSYGNEISNIAVSLAEGHGFSSPFPVQSGPTAWIPPVYPFLCSLLFRAAGGYGKAGIIWVLAMNSVFSAFTCIPLYRIANRVFGRKIALVSGWVFALCPYFARLSVTWIWETTLSTLFMTWMFLMILELCENDTLGNWVKYGIVWGVAMLNNPSILTLVAVSMLWFLDQGGRKSWKHIGAAILVCGIVISPWLVRNRIVMHKWIFIRSNFGFELNLGNFHGSQGNCGPKSHPWFSKPELDLYTKIGEPAYVAGHGAAAKDFIFQYPREFVRLCWWRFTGFWDGVVMRIRPDWRAIWLPQLYVILTFTTGLGLLLMAIRRMRIAYFLFLVIILYPWPYYIACMQTRFRHLIDPLMLMITIYLLFEAWRFAKFAVKRYREHEMAQNIENPAQ